MHRERAPTRATIAATAAILIAGLAACEAQAPDEDPTVAETPTEEEVDADDVGGLMGVYEIDVEPVDIDVTVSIVTDAFEPDRVEVMVGERVVWDNTSHLPHSVRVEDENPSPTVASGDAIARTFDEPGTYRYVCGIHPFMEATVVVDE